MKIHCVKSQRGFCVFELMAVLVILSIVCGGVYCVAAGELLKSSQIEQQSAELLAVFSDAEYSAAALRRTTRLEFDPTHGTVRENVTGEPAKTRFSLRGGVNFSRAAFGAARASSTESIFYPAGVTSPGSVVLSDRSGKTCTISQGLRGGRTLECSQATQ